MGRSTSTLAARLTTRSALDTSRAKTMGSPRNGRGRVFMNPPYGKTLGAWMRKAWEAAQNGAELVVCLVPVRSDTGWWHEFAARGEVTLLPGRLRFGEGVNPAPFPSAVVVFRNAQAVPKLAAQEVLSRG